MVAGTKLTVGKVRMVKVDIKDPNQRTFITVQCLHPTFWAQASISGMPGLRGYPLGYRLTKESQTLIHDWSASPNANNSNNAWGVNFNNGNDNNNNRNNNNHARLVRGGA